MNSHYSNQLLSNILEESIFFLEPLLHRAAAQAQKEDDNHQLNADIWQLSTLIASIDFFRDQLPPAQRKRPAIVREESETDVSNMGTSTENRLGERALTHVLAFMGDRSSGREYQGELSTISSSNRRWNEKATCFLWKSPLIATKRSLYMLCYCSRISLVRHEELNLYVKRLDLTGTRIADPADALLVNQAVKLFPHLQTLIWGINPISEYTIYLFLKNCVELNRLAIGGPIISSTKSEPHDYRFVFQRESSYINF
jgi:hypothetical protein